MTLGLWFPAALVALAALLVPIAIHLSRRTHERVTPFAALRWLEVRLPPRSRIRLTEWLLLLLRLLLVATLVLLLARPFVTPWPWAGSSRVLVHPALDAGAARAAFPDAPPEADWHWLAPGFPALVAVPAGTGVATASLLREADAALPANVALAVVVPEIVDGLDGERVALGRRVDWRIAPATPQAAAATPAREPLRLAVRHDADSASAVRYVQAAVAGWNARTPGGFSVDVATTDAPIPGDVRWLAWLAGEPPPDEPRWRSAGSVVLTHGDAAPEGSTATWRAADGAVLAWSAEAGEGRRVHLTGRMSPDTMPLLLDPDFPDRLHALFEGPDRPPARASAVAARPVLADTLPAPLPRPLDAPLIAMVVALFALERLLATGARPGATA